MVAQLVAIESYTHRHALHDLDPVPGRVLRRKDRQRGTRPRGEPQHPAVILEVRAIDISLDGDGLVDTDVLELRLLEIGIDPHGIERCDRDHFRGRAHLLSELYLAAHHVPGQGSAYDGSVFR